jgi:hypothetical protein
MNCRNQISKLSLAHRVLLLTALVTMARLVRAGRDLSLSEWADQRAIERFRLQFLVGKTDHKRKKRITT